MEKVEKMEKAEKKGRLGFLLGSSYRRLADLLTATASKETTPTNAALVKAVHTFCPLRPYYLVIDEGSDAI